MAVLCCFDRRFRVMLRVMKMLTSCNTSFQE
jgi:hypothetical protein